ncbi:MAG: 2OG-Fe(II) oxygenase [Rhizomicrobium sp.]
MPDPAPARTVYLPPYQLRHDLLPAALADELLAFAIARESRFVPSEVNRPHGVEFDPTWRISLMLPELGSIKDVLKAHVMPLAPELTAALGMEPFEPVRAELSLVAHGDGAFLTRHIDFLRARTDMPTRRLLSGVYYLHARPKGFSGGALRLHQLMARGPEAQFIDIEPRHNSMLFFPSFMPHEVRPVAVPSGRFAESRFAINFWIHGAR